MEKKTVIQDMFISKLLQLKQIQTLANLTLNLPEVINT